VPPIDPGISGIARVIQLAIAPVFLLTAIGALLTVLTNRLGRVIDRARTLEDRLPDAGATEQRHLHDDLTGLGARARLINRAITLSVAAALFVCAIIAALFLGAETDVEVVRVVSTLFVLAMCALIGALVTFLQEVFLATRTLRIGPRS
jgi:hypothetical protein